MLSRQEEEVERLATLENDLKVLRERGGTFFQHGVAAALDTAGGRFGAAMGAATVTGSTPVPTFLKGSCMTNKKDELAALRAEVDALKAAAPKPQPSAEERERATREWIDQMHQMREGRMSLATPPSVVRDMAVLDDNLVKGIALRDARAPTSTRSAASSNITPRPQAFTRPGAIGIGACANGPPVLAAAIRRD
jgi:hypothetical protein